MINWKIRIKNPMFLLQLVLSIGVPVLGYFGLSAQDITTWQTLIDLIVKAVSNPYVLGMIGVSLFHAINDPTTKGLKDSKLALQKKKLK